MAGSGKNSGATPGSLTRFAQVGLPRIGKFFLPRSPNSRCYIKFINYIKQIFHGISFAKLFRRTADTTGICLSGNREFFLKGSIHA
jgi:hypothetical protein